MRRIYFLVWIFIALIFTALNTPDLIRAVEPTPIAITTPESILEILQNSPDAYFGDVVMSPDFRQFAVVSCKKLFLYDASTYQIIRELPYSGDDRGCFAHVAFGSITDIAVTTFPGYPGQVEIWNTEFKRKAASVDVHGFVLALLFNVDKNLLVVGQENGIQSWDTDRLTENPPLIVIPEHYPVAYATGISSDAAVFALEDVIDPPSPVEHSVGIWNIKTRQRQVWLNTGYETPRAITFSPDGHLLAVGTETGLVQLWNVDGKEITAEFNAIAAGDDDKIVFLTEFSPDGKYLAAVTPGGFTVWRLVDGAQTESILIDDDFAAGLTFNPNDNTIILATNDKLQLWHFKR